MDTIDPLRFGLAFVFVLCLIGVLALVLKRFGPGGGVSKDMSQRLSVIETRYLDAKRKLVLIRRDDKEYLLLLAPDREVVLESGITAIITPDDDLEAPDAIA